MVISVGVFWHALEAIALLSFVLVTLASIGCYAVVWRRVYRQYKSQRPMGKKALRRLARVAPQLLHRAAVRQKEFEDFVTTLLSSSERMVCDRGSLACAGVVISRWGSTLPARAASRSWPQASTHRPVASAVSGQLSRPTALVRMRPHTYVY